MYRILNAIILSMFCLALSAGAQGKAVPEKESVKTISLPAPQTDIGKPLMQALRERQTIREYDKRDLGLQELSNLLWAANGINRPDSGKRTAPTAMNTQEIEVYVSKADGLYLYNAREHSLELVTAEDVRGLTGSQPFVKNAPVNLIFTADLSKFKRSDDESKNFYSAIDTGYVSQNVYLYCASEGLATVVRGSVDRAALAKAMKLKKEQKIIVVQTVGYPQAEKK